MTKDNCLVCQIVEGKVPSEVIYEDDLSMAVLDVNGSNPGHCFVLPKQHYPILEQVPDDQVGHLFSIANTLSKTIFEQLGVGGTNIFVSNGIPAGQTVAHFMVNVIPRSEGDGVNLQWNPQQVGDEEMKTIQLKVQEEIGNTAVPSVVPSAPPQSAAPSTPGSSPAQVQPPKYVDENDQDDSEERLRRIP